MSTNLRIKAWLLLAIFFCEIFSPLHLLALTSGPSQPEMAEFTPYGTTEMVDPFTGDFTYNIPLMDVEGYPINIAYNSGVTMEQEASWVGLGWNLNLGTINRSVRGLPDDFKGDVISSITNIKEMEITKFGGGVGMEIFGSNVVDGKKVAKKLGMNANVGLSFIYNNYKGFGIATESSMGPSLNLGGLKANASLGFGLNTLDGASFSSSLGVSLQKTNENDNSMSFGGSMGSGYSTRTGQKYLSLGTSAGYKQVDKPADKSSSKSLSGSATFLPIGMETYTPYPKVQMTSESMSFSASVGGELFGVNGNVNIHGSKTTQELVDENNNKTSYGYLYSEEASDQSLMDFNREQEVSLNKTIENLSPVNYTYDVYSVNGQGVAGTFRPLRNEIANLHDPYYAAPNQPNDISLGVEVGLGGYFHGGANVNTIDVISNYGGWNGAAHSKFKFSKNEINNPFEKVYFKAAGDLSESDMDYFNNDIEGVEALAYQLNGMNTNATLLASNGSSISELNPNYSGLRKARSKVFSYLTAEEAKHIGNYPQIYSYWGMFYNDHSDPGNILQKETIPRHGGVRKAHHLSQITQTNPDGERYVFGIPAYNISKYDVNYNTNLSPDNNNRVTTDNIESSISNNAGVDNYYSYTGTPAYAHSFLLTEKQSNDYQDITGNGISPDDLGEAWKFNYTRKSANYKWRIPYIGSNFSKGHFTKDDDQKASYSGGAKELWYVHSIESKNQIAEFKITPRRDALGASSDINGNRPNPIEPDDRSWKLDEIVLYNKYDRIKNGAAAVPIKTVEFNYSYSLCPGVVNQSIIGDGKLTLESIEISYGGSDKGKLSPYVFKYSGDQKMVVPGSSVEFYPGNYQYNSTYMDRWGNYKDPSVNPAGSSQENDDYPYVVQENSSADEWASAWSLREIMTPSGGIIIVDYESDDYAYVQNRRAMQMFPVVGAIDPNGLEPELYGNHQIVIDSEIDVSNMDQNDLRKAFFAKNGPLDDMYFRFFTNITSSEKEFVSGYTKAVDIGFYNNDKTTGLLWVQLEGVLPNPISKIAWGYFRENLFDKLYNQPSINDGSNLKSVIKGLAANFADIQQLFTGVEDYLKNRRIANDFDINKSFVRLYNPLQNKKGGGSRVSRITLNDNWGEMADGEDAEYGQTYEYTTKDENGNEISSGVATYEPMIGNDENPFKEPVPYVSAGNKGHIPAIDAYQERPFGESFFPSASVGYSKVKVKNINANIGKTSNAITEHSFYTAKDFPVITKETKIQIHNSPSTNPKMSFPFKNQTNRSEFSASQGYSIVLNDMHGKPSTTRTYAIFSGVEKDISGTKYNYHHENTPDGKILKNEVDVISREGYVSKKLLGVEHDLAIDSRKSYEATETRSDLGSVDIIPGIFGLTLPIPSYYNHTIRDESEVRTVVVTKVVQMYGILKSVENYTDQYSTTVYNRLYDGHTGEVLLTETKDEHNINEFQFSVPAYLTEGLQRMGGAYQNINFEATIEPTEEGNCTGYKNPGYLKHGDEVLIFPQTGSPTQAWIDLNISDINSSSNGRDPIINSYCEPDWTFSTISDSYLGFCATISSFTRNTYNMSYISSGIQDIAYLYLPNKRLSSFLLNPYSDPIYDNTDELHNIENTFCDLFGTDEVSNNPTIFSYLLNISQGLRGLNQPTNFYIENLFDLSDPIPVRTDFTDGHRSYIKIAPEVIEHKENLVDLLENSNKFFRDNGTNSHNNSIFLIKYIYDNQGVSEDVYFLRPYKQGNFQDPYLQAVSNPILQQEEIPNNNAPCINTFQLIDRNGSVLSTLNTGDKIKIIRSGNRNMLTTKEGNVVATSNPINVIDGKFAGIKEPSEHPDIQILKISAQEFSEDVTIRSNQDNSSYNKFLNGTDGQFKIKKTFRYSAKRKQNNLGVEIAKDGYTERIPWVWETVDEDCSFRVTSISSNSSSWHNEEEITAYDENGNSLESKNDLDLYSSVLFNPQSKVEAVATNAQQKEILVESFENYRFLQTQYRFWGHHLKSFNTLATSLYDHANVNYAHIETSPSHSAVEIKGEAHSGNYSIFLKGSDASFSDPIQFNYTEKPMPTLIRKEIGEHPVSLTHTFSMSKAVYNNFKSGSNGFEGQYINNQAYSLQTELTNAIANGTSEFTISVDPNANYGQANYAQWHPKAGRHYFSIWMKEILPTNLPYHGNSPSVDILIDGIVSESFTTNSGVIDGWYKITGEFDYPEATGDPLVYSTIDITLKGGLWGAFFDDMRIHPIESNMTTYVYDQITGHLKAQLDENNYATFYEYDEEGIPVQVKKETASGVLTVSESRQSKHNHPIP